MFKNEKKLKIFTHWQKMINEMSVGLF